MSRRILGVVAAAAAAAALLTGVHGQVQREAGTWQPAASLSGIREGASAVLLQDGRVLMLGGRNEEGPVASAEIYAGGVWSPVNGLGESWGQTATVLADGRVLIVGGENEQGLTSLLDLFDPVANTVTPAGTLSSPRKGHAATLLADGRVLVAGGFNGEHVVSAIEIFDPETGSISAAPFSLTVARAGLSATTLIDGRVLLAGGNDGTDDLALAEVFNVSTGSVSVRAMSRARRDHQAVLLPHNNHVLLVGGSSNGEVAGAELYRSWTGEFVETAAPAAPRVSAAASPLMDEGWALVAGGSEQASAERYAFATVTTDQKDYAPTETVHVSGGGWIPNEDVTLTVRELPAEHESLSFTVTADATGRILNVPLFDVEDHHVGVRFYLTAIGSASQAQITFTDGNFRFLSSGPTVSNIGWQLFSNSACTAPLSGGGTSGIGNITVTDSSSGTLQVPADTNQWLGLTVPEASAGEVFQNWVAQSGNPTFTTSGPGQRTICVAGDSGSGLRRLRANYVAPTVRQTSAAVTRSAGSNPSIYGNAVTFTATVTATGGNPNSVGTVTFTLDGTTTLCSAVSLSGNTALCSPGPSVLRGPGPHTVTAVYSGTTSGLVQFADSPISPGLAHEISARAITFKADDVTRTYGESTPAFTYSVSAGSIVGGDAFGTPSYSAAGSTVGSHVITLSGLANPNYQVSFDSGTLTVTARPITFKADDVTRTYGDSTPAFTYSVSAGTIVPGDTFGTPIYSPAGLTVGSHVITLGGLANPNYQVSLVPGTLTVLSRPLAVAADDKAKVLGAADPALTYHITSGNLVNGDTLTGALVRAAGEAVGSYAIGQGTVSAGSNYALTFVPGIFKIEYAPASVPCLGGYGKTILQPINANGLSVFKQGATVPAKFRVCDASGNSVGTPGVVTAFRLVQVKNGTVTLVNEEVVSTAADTAFRWSADGAQWIFNINTKNLQASQTYVYEVSLNDGSSFTFQFGLK